MEVVSTVFDILISAIVHGLSVLFWLGMAIGLICMVIALVAAAAWVKLRREMEYPDVRDHIERYGC